MFNKIKNLIKNKINKKQLKAFREVLDIKNIKAYDYKTKASIDNINAYYDNHKTKDNVIDFSRCRKQKILDKTKFEKINIDTKNYSYIKDDEKHKF